MLQQILKQMYIDPELLNELSEEQKQILFIKLREEQIRRWKEEDEKHEKAQAKNNIKPKKPPKPGKQPKTVQFLTARDGNEWVWVMGEHENDLSIEQMLEREAQSEAERKAAKEAEKIRKEEELEIKKQDEKEKNELKRKKLKREAEIRENIHEGRKKEEAELYQSLKEARLEAERLEKEKKEKEEEEKEKLRLLNEKKERSRKKSVDNANIMKKRRSTEIFKRWQENREIFEKMAIENSKELDKSWQEQEKKAKEAEYHRKEIARHAREEIKGTLTRGTKVIQATNAFKARLPPEKKPPIPPKRNVLRDQNSIKKSKYRTEPLPPNRQAVVDWFINEEKPRGAGIDLQTNEIAEWFHGIISRTEAEKILEGCKKGSFIVRVSERVWGYTISYKTDDRLKHFLIDTSEEGYQFFGANQVRHETLSDLVNFHKEAPITIISDEKLLYPVGQTTAVPNYSELFPHNMVMTPL